MFAAIQPFGTKFRFRNIMLLHNLIKDTIPPLKTSDTAATALKWMEEFRHSNLPVIGENGYAGMIYESDLLKIEKTNTPLSALSIPFNRQYVNEYQHIFDAIKFAANNEFTIVPVLSNSGQYLGLVTVMDIIKALSDANSLQNPGGTVVLEIEKDKYSLSEIARIVEAEGAQILSAHAIISKDPEKIEVTLKINRIDLTRILAGFFRNDFEVMASYHQSEFQDDIQNKYDAFMNYLKM
jgi:acetoin utilization protein AcuB